jgi:hypothetical protein
VAKTHSKTKTMRLAVTGYKSIASGRTIGKPTASVTVHEAIGKPKPLPNPPHLRGDKTLSELVTKER